MSRLLDLDILTINKMLKNKEIKPIDLVNECFERIEENKDLNAFITLDKEKAIEEAKRLENVEVDNPLFGMPIAIKDNILTKDLRTTCASRILENFIPIYDATIIEKIKDAHMIIIGKTNMDEFAMGSTSETSYFGAPKNPWNKNKIAGGSSGGSAVCVAANITPLSLGSDTGGSIRQPASYCNIVGMKPTYGRVSRYGVVAFGSSLDQVGPMTRTVLENACLLNVISGHDEKDLTSANIKEDFTRLIGEDISGMKVAIPTFFTKNVEKEVLDKLDLVKEFLKAHNVTVDYVDIRHLDKVSILYQIIAMGEASSNLARFDGVRYGYSYPNPTNLDELYTKTRGLGFGDEVKRRIMVGSYILSGKNAKIYYNKALQIRDDIRKSFKKVFEKYDLVIGPVATTVAYDFNTGKDNPLRSFMDDVLVMPANMAGLPALSVPVGFSKDKMPIGLQIIGDSFQEALIYKLAAFIEKELRR